MSHPSEQLIADAADLAKRVVDRLKAAEYMRQYSLQNEHADLAWWTCYVTVYGQSISLHYNPPDDTPWRDIARGIVALRNVYGIPTLRRTVNDGGSYISNAYSGGVHDGDWYVHITISTGATLPPACKVVETEEVQTVKRLKVVCDA